MSSAIALSVCSSLCFGIALVSGRLGLRSLTPRTGASISIPSATLIFIVAAPFALDLSEFNPIAAIFFALVGLFFPALVTLITFHSSEKIGPTTTSAVSGTAPLFALVAAGVLLGEDVSVNVFLAALAISTGIALIVGHLNTDGEKIPGGSIAWSLLGALLRGVAQTIAKAGLLLWPQPFAASLIGYCVSCAVLALVGRAPHPSGKPDHTGTLWFVCTGLLNGTAVLLMYAAIQRAPVSVVAPVVATYPLVTALTGALVLRDESLTRWQWLGIVISVSAVAWLLTTPGS